MEMKELKIDNDRYFSIKDSVFTKNLSKTVFYLLMFFYQLFFSMIHMIILFADVLKDFINETKSTIIQRRLKIQKNKSIHTDHK